MITVYGATTLITLYKAEIRKVLKQNTLQQQSALCPTSHFQPCVQ